MNLSELHMLHCLELLAYL